MLINQQGHIRTLAHITTGGYYYGDKRKSQTLHLCR